MEINDREYFEGRGLNVFVFGSQYNGMFFDEKTAGIELIHHGVRTATGGAIRLTDGSQWTFPASVPDADCPMATDHCHVASHPRHFSAEIRGSHLTSLPQPALCYCPRELFALCAGWDSLVPYAEVVP